MTPAKLIEDLRRRGLTVVFEGHLIRVECPDARPVWVSLNMGTGVIRVGADRSAPDDRSIFHRAEVGHYDDTAKIVCMVAYALPSPPRVEDLHRLLGGPFDAVARDWARAIAAGIRVRAERDHARIAADLDAAKARADREGAAAELEMKRARSYLEILEPTP
jgi:hypothetical protein